MSIEPTIYDVLDPAPSPRRPASELALVVRASSGPLDPFVERALDDTERRLRNPKQAEAEDVRRAAESLVAAAEDVAASAEVLKKEAKDLPGRKNLAGQVGKLAASAHRSATGLADDAESIADELPTNGSAPAPLRVWLRRVGLFDTAVSVVKQLNATSLPRRSKLLLSREGVLGYLFHKGKTALGTTSAIGPWVDFLGSEVADLPDALFTQAIVDAVILQNRISLPAGETAALIRSLQATDYPLQPGGVEPFLLRRLERAADGGTAASAVARFISQSSIRPSLFTTAVRRAMIEYIVDLGVDARKLEPNSPELILAYQHARGLRDGGADPIDAVRSRGLVTSWDFEVDTFESLEEQGVIPANIKAAGALDYVYVLGDLLGVFPLLDALVVRWAGPRGSRKLDIASGPVADRLYRYWKLRNERVSTEERGMLYRAVLNKGEGELLSGMEPNEGFSTLWDKLISEAARYLEKRETTDNSLSVSRTSVYQATRQLQYNLSETMTGMTHLQVAEMYAQLKEAMDILSDPSVSSAFGSSVRKDVWSTIERASGELLGSTPNVAAVRSLAVDGNRVFRWVADFDQAVVTDEQFDSFLEAAEAWLISAATIGESTSTEAESPDEEDEDIPDDDADFEADWNE